MNVPQSGRFCTLATFIQQVQAEVRAAVVDEYCRWGRAWLKAHPWGRAECSNCGVWVDVDLDGNSGFVWNTEDADLCKSPPLERCRHLRHDIDRVFPGRLAAMSDQTQPPTDELAPTTAATLRSM